MSDPHLFIAPVDDAPSGKYNVRFIGTADDPKAEANVKIPMDLDQTPYMCVGDEPYFHYVRTGPSDSREYHYAGPCAQLPQMRHIHPGSKDRERHP